MAVNFTGLVNFKEGITEKDIKGAEKMTSKIDEFLRADIENNTNAKAALLTKNVADSLGTSAHYAIKLNTAIHASIISLIIKKIAAKANIPSSHNSADDRVISFGRSLIDKWVSESLKNSNSDLVQEYAKALDSQFKSDLTNLPLHLLKKENKKFKGLFLFSQVMLVNKLKILEKSLDESIDKSLEKSLEKPKLKLMTAPTIALNGPNLKNSLKPQKKPNNNSLSKSKSMKF